MKRRNFTETDYAQTHPAGQLGRNLLFTVDEVMHRLDKIAVIQRQTLISDLVIEMTKFPLGAACIVEKDELLGIITDGDLRRSLVQRKDLLKMNAEQIMTKSPQSIIPTSSLGNALKKMEKGTKQISVLPVINSDTNHLLGLLRLHDIYNPISK